MSDTSQNNNQSEVTPGGSRIIRSKTKAVKEMSGFLEISTTGILKQREKIYKEIFGPGGHVNHEVLPLVPHLDVYLFPPVDTKRPFHTIVSGGMSDLQMELEPDIDNSQARREIILYANEPEEKYIDLVRFYARFPFMCSTWLGHGHTIPNGDPPQPLFEKSRLNAILFLYSRVHPDQDLGEHFIIDNDPVEFLWLVPITQAELDYKLNYGTDALLALFDQVNHPLTINPSRSSYV